MFSALLLFASPAFDESEGVYKMPLLRQRRSVARVLIALYLMDFVHDVNTLQASCLLVPPAAVTSAQGLRPWLGERAKGPCPSGAGKRRRFTGGARCTFSFDSLGDRRDMNEVLQELRREAGQQKRTTLQLLSDRYQCRPICFDTLLQIYLSFRKDS